MRSFQSPRGDFGFLKKLALTTSDNDLNKFMFQSPRGDFGFLKQKIAVHTWSSNTIQFQSPRGDFGFLKRVHNAATVLRNADRPVSIPSRGFWFFEGDAHSQVGVAGTMKGFNPLAGILVF